MDGLHKFNDAHASNRPNRGRRFIIGPVERIQDCVAKSGIGASVKADTGPPIGPGILATEFAGRQLHYGVVWQPSYIGMFEQHWKLPKKVSTIRLYRQIRFFPLLDWNTMSDELDKDLSKMTPDEKLDWANKILDLKEKLDPGSVQPIMREMVMAETEKIIANPDALIQAVMNMHAQPGRAFAPCFYLAVAVKLGYLKTANN